MGFLSLVQYTFQDILCKLRVKKWTFVLCVLISVAGFALGIALFFVCRDTWWYYNRCDNASRLVQTGFITFLNVVLSAALTFLLLVLCNMTKVTHYLTHLVNFFVCFYVGATLAAVFVYSVLWGALYAALVVIEWLAVVCIACFICLCEKAYCRRFCESFRDLKQVCIVLVVGLIYKILAMFVILKLLTALI